MKLKNKLKKYTYDLVKSSYLCIRFPFLYTHNRFSDRHYTNWYLTNKRHDLYKEQFEWSKNHIQEYVDKFGKECLFLNGKCVKSDYIMKLADYKTKFLYWFYDKLEKFYGLFHFIPTYTELDAMPNGWRKRFGIQFCKELKQAIKETPTKDYMRNFRIMQIKEKWGTLQCYVNYSSESVSRVINKYEYISQFVCINCGKDAVKKTTGWICPYCEDCLPTNCNWIWIDPIYDYSNFEHAEYNKKLAKE